MYFVQLLGFIVILSFLFFIL